MNFVGQSPPISIKKIEVTDTTATVTWTQSKGANGYVILLDMGEVSHRQTFVTKKTNMVFTDLPAKTTGSVLVVAMPGNSYVTGSANFETK
jgi:transcriptional regulatory protein LevR